MKRVSVYVDQMQLFVIKNNVGIMINVDVNVKNYLIKVYVIKGIVGFLVIASVNVINHAILVSIQIMKIVNGEKNQQINYLMNVMKIQMKQVELKFIR